MSLTDLVKTAAILFGRNDDTTAAIKSSNGTKIVVSFNSREEKEEWLTSLDDSCPSSTSYYDSLIDAMNDCIEE
jgi:hypothetical protein